MFGSDGEEVCMNTDLYFLHELTESNYTSQSLKSRVKLEKKGINDT